jgi:pantoate--beta-alanine ligase
MRKRNMPKRNAPRQPSRTRPRVFRTVSSLRLWLLEARRGGKTLALVPTMGALHQGHLALVQRAQQKCDRVIVSIFVNPTQFAPNEDLASYPRTWDSDVAALTALNVDAIWAPAASVMYPDGFATKIVPGGPALAGLEDKFRPHFFGGVCTVVAKLLCQVQPDIGLFGEKDFQQLKTVTAMARDLDLQTKILGVPTVREKDGLAMSSRNAYLSTAERAAAPALYQALKECAARLRAGEGLAETLAAAKAQIEAAGFVLDYLEARNAKTLAPIAALADGPQRLLVAARIGRTRLIDNVGVKVARS